MRLRTNDDVIVIAGKYKGKVSKVKKVYPKINKILIEGVNIVKKHLKSDPNRGIEGGIKSIELPLDASNVAIYNLKAKKADKVKYIFEEDKKVRVFSSSGEKVGDV